MICEIVLIASMIAVSANRRTAPSQANPCDNVNCPPGHICIADILGGVQCQITTTPSPAAYPYNYSPTTESPTPSPTYYSPTTESPTPSPTVTPTTTTSPTTSTIASCSSIICDATKVCIEDGNLDGYDGDPACVTFCGPTMICASDEICVMDGNYDGIDDDPACVTTCSSLTCQTTETCIEDGNNDGIPGDAICVESP